MLASYPNAAGLWAANFANAAAASQAVGRSNFLTGGSVAGGGVDDGLMRFNRFNRSASDECEGKGNENESLFHSRIPSLTVSVCPGWRRVAVTKITECSFQDLPLLPFGAHRGELRQAAGTVRGAAAEKRGVTRLQGRLANGTV